jgi:hypothetical protein
MGKHRRPRGDGRSRAGCAVIAVTAPLALLALVHEVLNYLMG